jgi:hypothetical protein
MAMYNNVEVSFAKKLSREQTSTASASSNTTINITPNDMSSNTVRPIPITNPYDALTTPTTTTASTTTPTPMNDFYKELSLILINKFKNITKGSIANDIDTSGLIILKIEELASLISILTSIPIESINIVERVEYDVDCLGKIRGVIFQKIQTILIDNQDFMIKNNTEYNLLKSLNISLKTQHV